LIIAVSVVVGAKCAFYSIYKTYTIIAVRLYTGARKTWGERVSIQGITICWWASNTIACRAEIIVCHTCKAISLAWIATCSAVTGATIACTSHCVLSWIACLSADCYESQENHEA